MMTNNILLTISVNSWVGNFLPERDVQRKRKKNVAQLAVHWETLCAICSSIQQITSRAFELLNVMFSSHLSSGTALTSESSCMQKVVPMVSEANP